MSLWWKVGHIVSAALSSSHHRQTLFSDRLLRQQSWRCSHSCATWWRLCALIFNFSSVRRNLKTAGEKRENSKFSNFRFYRNLKFFIPIYSFFLQELKTRFAVMSGILPVVLDLVWRKSLPSWTLFSRKLDFNRFFPFSLYFRLNPKNIAFMWWTVREYVLRVKIIRRISACETIYPSTCLVLNFSPSPPASDSS